MKQLTARDALLDAVVNHVLAEGSTSATLRDLAKAAGSNNRMLLYYFESKEQLLATALDAALLRYPLIQNLDSRLADTDVHVLQRLRDVWEELSQPENLPFIRLLLESVIQASRLPTSNPELLRHFNEDWTRTVRTALAAEMSESDASLLARRVVAFWRGLQLDLLSGGNLEELKELHDHFVSSIGSEYSLRE